MSASGPGSAARFVTEVMLTYGSQLHRFLCRRLERKEDAADIAQEVYLRLLKLPRTDLIRKPHAYVYFVAAQIAAEHRMREKLEPLTLDADAPELLTDETTYLRPDTAAEATDSARRIKRLLGQIPLMHRNVLLLSRRDGLSHKEIARQLNISGHTVKKYLYEATARIAFLKQEKENPHA